MKHLAIGTALASVALAATACGSASTHTKLATQPSAEAAAAVVESTISAALPGGHWEQEGGNLEGAYRQDVYIMPDPLVTGLDSGISVDLFRTSDLAAKAVPTFGSIGFYFSVDQHGPILVLVENSASSAAVAAANIAR